MAPNIEYLHSDILSVIAKEMELRGDGYQARKLSDEYQLERDEYLLRAPTDKNSSVHNAEHSMSIIWRVS